MNIHEETLKIARDLIKKDPSLTDWVISKFPELKESEDEKIKKELVAFVESRLAGFPKCDRFIAWLEKQGEQKPAEWSEEDEVRINRIVACLENLNVSDNDILLKDVDWLKSLKDRVQPKQELSQNDINMIDWLIRCCEKEHEELCNDKYGHQDIVSDLKRDCRKKWDWLESLKNRVAPQKQWKPSEEQMDALNDVISSRDIKYDVLSELWKDLKKLMEE